MDEFVYDPLPTPTSIRLLRRDGKTASGLLQFSLVTVGLVDNPIYHCLSYTWGNPYSNGIGFEEYFHAQAPNYAADKQHPVLCNGKILKIGRNLHDAMEELPMDCFFRDLRERDTQDGASTKLHIAAKRGLCTSLSGQIQNGADISAQDSSGRTPLNFAVLHNQLEAARALLDAGADPNTRDNQQKRPVTYSWENQNIEMTLLLISRMSHPARTALLRAYPNPDNLIWIDSICISQKDVEERSVQVSKMQKIYDSAEFVLVWLGKADPSTQLAAETIYKLGQAEEILPSTDIIPYETTAKEVYEAFGVPYISIEAWDALARLLTRQWFQRIWVIQEVVLAASIIVYCGQHTIKFDVLSSVCDSLMQLYHKSGHYPSVHYLISETRFSPIEEFLSLMSELRLQRFGSLQFGREIGYKAVEERLETSFHLPRLIKRAITFLATDPRDKIYALLPLAQLKPNNEFRFIPDYTNDVDACYTYVTVELLLGTEDLNLLSWVQKDSESRRPRLPSWVPDYSLPKLNHTIWNVYDTFTLEAQDPHFFGILRLHEELALGELGVGGYEFDTIARVGRNQNYHREDRFTLDPDWFQLCLSLDIKYHTGESRTEALWRTLCTDQNNDHRHPAPTDFKDYFKRLVCAMLCAQAEEYVRCSSESFLETWNIFGDLLTTMVCGNQGAVRERIKLERMYQAFWKMCHLSDTEAIHPSFSGSHTPSLTEIENYFQNRGHVSLQGKNRWLEEGYTPSVSTEALNPFGLAYNFSYPETRLFVTKRKYIGVGPLSIREGDSVFLLPSANVPFILSQEKKHVNTEDQLRRFSLVGEAYVHGIMHGEALTRHPELKEEFEGIYLV